MSQEWAIRVDGLTKLYKRRAALDGVTYRRPDRLGLRPPGRERGGQVDDDQGIARADRARRRSDRDARTRPDPRRPGSPPEGRLRGRTAWPLRMDDRGRDRLVRLGLPPSNAGRLGGVSEALPGPGPGFDLPPTRKIKALSKGMRAKVGLALALAPEPELLVLDEPTSGLDVLVRREFLESMVDLAGEGRTVLLSSHQIGEVERVASHVALLHQGKLVLAEPLDELRSRTHVLNFTLDGVARSPLPPADSGLELVDAIEAPRQARWLVHATDRSAPRCGEELAGRGRDGGRDRQPRRHLHCLHQAPDAHRRESRRRGAGFLTAGSGISRVFVPIIRS